MSYGLEVGSCDLRSAGPIVFGPDGILFVADNAAARVIAVAVSDQDVSSGTDPFDCEDVDGRVAAYLGCAPGDVTIHDVVVHPLTGNIYLSVQRRTGEEGQGVVLKLDRRDATIVDVPLSGVPMAEYPLSDAPSDSDERTEIFLPIDEEGEEFTYEGRAIRIAYRPIRTATITDMAYAGGELLVAGLSNEEFSSKLRRIPFPFTREMSGTNLEIFHVSHGKWETHAPVRAFVAYDEGRSIVATYTCTPVVRFDLTESPTDEKLIGETLAELGAMNRPLDMITFAHEGAQKLLIANSSYGLVKIDCGSLGSQEALVEPYFTNHFPDWQREPVGLPRERVDLMGVTRLANLNSTYVLALQAATSGSQSLRSLKVGSL